MPIDFPNSPTTGQVYTYQGQSWIWNGTGWDRPRGLSEVGAVSVFADATARTAAIPTPTEGMVSYLNDVDALQVNNGSAWLPIVSIGAWTTYTPTLTSMALGNGTMSAKYAIIGKTMHLRFDMTFGSTSTVSGAARFSLPSGITTPMTVNQPCGIGVATIGSGFALQVWPFSSSVIIFKIQRADGTHLATENTTSTTPGTWTTGSTLGARLTLEIN